jgi:two-component system response regulator FixJ
MIGQVEASQATTGTAGGSVYIVAGDEGMAAALAGMVREAGWEVAIFASPAQLLGRLEALGAGCIVSALCVNTADGAVLLHELAARCCPFPVVALAPAGDVGTAVRAMKAGAVDVVALPLEADALAQAVREALEGRARPVGGGAIPENLRLRLERLTRRERQVLDAMVRGDGNKAIAHDLGISPRTVEVHRAKVMEKLSCRSLPDVVRLAVQAGLMRA